MTNYSDKVTRWSLSIIQERGNRLLGDRYDFGEVKEEHVKNVMSRIPVRCRVCSFLWRPIINNLFNARTGCPSCGRPNRYTYERVVREIVRKYKGKIDASAVREKQVERGSSMIPVRCTVCSFRWTLSVANAVNGKASCVKCCGDEKRLSYESFVEKMKKVHGDTIDYGEAEPDTIYDTSSKLFFDCRLCFRRWEARINCVVGGSGCPYCDLSRGESEVEKALVSRGIEFRRRFVIESRLYDYQFEFGGRMFLLELDGSEHFTYIPFYHKDLVTYRSKQDIDIEKTCYAISRGFSIIRIDYLSVGNVDSVIQEALERGSALYLSNRSMYYYLGW